jgi:hypothetical protein
VRPRARAPLPPAPQPDQATRVLAAADVTDKKARRACCRRRKHVKTAEPALVLSLPARCSA